MLSYYRTMQWHEEHDKQANTPTPGNLFQLHLPILNCQDARLPVETSCVSQCSYRLKKKERYNLSHVLHPKEGAHDFHIGHTFIFAQADT